MKIFFIVCILFYTNFCLAEENIKITTEGSGISKRLAIQDALKTAVDDAAGVTIDTNTIIVNNRLSGSKISSYSGGYIKEYTILEEKYENKIYYVKIEAIVATGSPDIQENNINTFDINIKDNIEYKKQSFENIINQTLPKYKEMLNKSIYFKMNNFEKITSENNLSLCSFTLQINTDMKVYDNVVNKLNDFFINIKLNKKTGNYKLIIDNSTSSAAYSLNKNEFDLFKSILNDDRLYYNINLLNETGRILDTISIEKAEKIINISENIIRISPVSLKENKYDIYFSTKALNSAKQINITTDIKKDNGYFIGLETAETNQGLKIISVAKNSPAAAAKLFYGDIITDINGKKITKINQLKELLSNLQNSYLSLNILRDSKIINITIFPERKLNQAKNYM